MKKNTKSTSNEDEKVTSSRGLTYTIPIYIPEDVTPEQIKREIERITDGWRQDQA